MLPKLNVLRLYALRTQFILARSLFAGSTSFCTHRLWAARHRYGCATMHSNTGRSTNPHLVTLYCVYCACKPLWPWLYQLAFCHSKAKATHFLHQPLNLCIIIHFASECLCHTELNKWISFSFPVVVQLWNPTKQYLAEICTLPTFQWVQMQNKKYMFSFPEVYTVIICNWPLKIGFNFNEIP